MKQIGGMGLLLAGTARADPYVSTNGVVGGTYETWATAASNIPHAVGQAVDGETIWVSNGSYTAGINLGTKAITIRSINGAEMTYIDGNNATIGFTINNAIEGDLECGEHRRFAFAAERRVHQARSARRTKR